MAVNYKKVTSRKDSVCKLIEKLLFLYYHIGLALEPMQSPTQWKKEEKKYRRDGKRSSANVNGYYKHAL